MTSRTPPTKLPSRSSSRASRRRARGCASRSRRARDGASDRRQARGARGQGETRGGAGRHAGESAGASGAPRGGRDMTVDLLSWLAAELRKPYRPVEKLEALLAAAEDASRAA